MCDHRWAQKDDVFSFGGLYVRHLTTSPERIYIDRSTEQIRLLLKDSLEKKQLNFPLRN